MTIGDQEMGGVNLGGGGDRGQSGKFINTVSDTFFVAKVINKNKSENFLKTSLFSEGCRVLSLNKTRTMVEQSVT